MMNMPKVQNARRSSEFAITKFEQSDYGRVINRDYQTTDTLSLGSADILHLSVVSEVWTIVFCQ